MRYYAQLQGFSCMDKHQLLFIGVLNNTCPTNLAWTCCWGGQQKLNLLIIFMLKYFHGSWQPTIIKDTQCILYTNICALNFRGSRAL